VIRITRKYRFSASHRLHAPGLSASENAELYGKCNHPYGHGHNYEIEVSARGPVEERSGRALDPRVLDRLVEEQVLRPFDGKNLNVENAAFEDVVPTTENLAREIYRRLAVKWTSVFPGPWPVLERVRIAETPRNIFEVKEYGET
jgi:6-pyruvoyltetrahydropterin/6-carboxytetrahydropterin synthase